MGPSGTLCVGGVARNLRQLPELSTSARGRAMWQMRANSEFTSQPWAFLTTGPWISHLNSMSLVLSFVRRGPGGDMAAVGE